MKQIILLSVNRPKDLITYTVAFWYQINVNPLPTTNGSIWPGASTQENQAIQAGTVLEEIEAFSFPGNIQLGTIKDTLSNRYVLRNGQIAGIGSNQWVNIYEDSSTGWSG